MFTSWSASPNRAARSLEVGRDRLERVAAEHEQLGEHLADDAGDHVAVGLQVRDVGEHQRPVVAGARHELGHAARGARGVPADARLRLGPERGERLEHRGHLADQLDVAGVRRRVGGAPSLGRAGLDRDASAARDVVVLEQRGEAVERVDAPLARPVRRVLEGVGDAEEQIGDGDFAPRRLGQQRNRQRERPAGLDQQVVEISHDDAAARRERRV